MFDVSSGELVLIAVVGVVVLGPKRSIEVFREAGNLWRKLRAELADTKDILGQEVKKEEKK